MNLIKKNEIGSIIRLASTAGTERLDAYEVKNKVKLKVYLVHLQRKDGSLLNRTSKAYKCSDIGKVLNLPGKEVADRIENIRRRAGQPQKLTIFKPKK